MTNLLIYKVVDVQVQAARGVRVLTCFIDWWLIDWLLEQQKVKPELSGLTRFGLGSSLSLPPGGSLSPRGEVGSLFPLLFLPVPPPPPPQGLVPSLHSERSPVSPAPAPALPSLSCLLCGPARPPAAFKGGGAGGEGGEGGGPAPVSSAVFSHIHAPAPPSSDRSKSPPGSAPRMFICWFRTSSVPLRIRFTLTGHSTKNTKLQPLMLR